MKHNVVFLPNGIRVSVEAGRTIMEAMIEAGLAPDAPCGGKGTCGKCRVIIDGSEVLTHFTPTRNYSGVNNYESHSDLAYFTTYNAMITPTQIKGAWQRFQQKGVDNHFIMSYGFGDGGGGTTEAMIENARRMKNPVAQMPAVKQQM